MLENTENIFVAISTLMLRYAEEPYKCHKWYEGIRVLVIFIANTLLSSQKITWKMYKVDFCRLLWKYN